MKKVIVFGATGNTGRYLIRYLLDNVNLQEYEIIAIGRKAREYVEIDRNVTYFSVDITKKKDFEILPKEDVYAVVNFAGAMPAQMKEYNPQQYIDVNVTGTLNILEYCKENNVDRIIYPQTEADLSGYWGKEKVLKPDLPRKYSLKGNYAPYIISKCTAVDLITHYHEQYGIKMFIFRLPTIYLYKENPYYYVNFEKKMLGYRFLIDKAIKGEDIELWGDPKKEKDIVYVKDYCQMIFKALFVNKEKGIYNVGTGKAISLQEQIEGIIEVFSPEHNKSKIVYYPEKPDSREFIMDISNAKEELGYEPKYSYIEYLKDFKNEMEKEKNNK